MLQPKLWCWLNDTYIDRHILWEIITENLIEDLHQAVSQVPVERWTKLEQASTVFHSQMLEVNALLLQVSLKNSSLKKRPNLFPEEFHVIILSNQYLKFLWHSLFQNLKYDQKKIEGLSDTMPLIFFFFQDRTLTWAS